MSEAMVFTPIPPGAYVLKIDSVEIGTAKTSGMGMLKVKFIIQKPGDKEIHNRQLRRNFMLEGRGAGFTYEFLKAAIPGFTPEGDFEPRALFGKQIEAWVFHEKDLDTGELKQFPDAKNFRPYGGQVASMPGQNLPFAQNQAAEDDVPNFDEGA